MSKTKIDNRIERLRLEANNLPEKPGSYQFYNSEGEIIYVGKAKNLKARVTSYFHKEVDRYKTKVLVGKIEKFSYTVVNTEDDALLLENSLIKKYTPRYNVLLKDSKTYPGICITNEEFPRIFPTRRMDRRMGTYFGPYSNVAAMHNILDLLKKLYKPRSCRMPMTRESIERGTHKSCLEYHINHCYAPCIGKQSKQDYLECINQCKEILKGNTKKVSKLLYSEMTKRAAEMRFEEAEEIKKKYLLVENFRAKSEVVNVSITDADVFTSTSNDDENTVFINYLHVKNGTINQCFTLEYKRKMEESEADILLYAISDIREKFCSKSKEIIVPYMLEWHIPQAELHVPQRGDKKKLLELSFMNGRQYRFDRMKRTEKLNPEQRSVRLMKQLQEKLRLHKMPYVIECFDNSNISGSDAVAGCVVFHGMKPSKKDYRRYNIKTVEGPDDYESMREVVRRRYSRMIEEGSPLPDLIITDGGKGQMSAVKAVVWGELKTDIAVAGLAKNEHHRTNELVYGAPPQIVGIKPSEELFKVLTFMQDEVHRFAITFHRDKRSRHALHSELDDIKGIGPKTKQSLIRTFKSVKNIKAAHRDELIQCIGEHKTNLLLQYFAAPKE